MNFKANGCCDYDASRTIHCLISLCTPIYYEFDPAGYGTLSSDVCVTGVRPPCEELGVLPKPSCEFER